MNHTEFNARVAAVVARAELPAVSCTEDIADKRIKIRFQLPPDRAVCQLLKANGFGFRGGSAQWWVRRLDDAGRAAARLVMAQLTGEHREEWGYGKQ